MKKRYEKENAITLAALVITVIIMLILAGVAVSILRNDGGLFDKTRGAADAYDKATMNEAELIAWLDNKINIDVQPVQIKDFKFNVTRTATAITVTGETTPAEMNELSGFQFMLKEDTNTRTMGEWTELQEEPIYTFTKDNDGIEENKVYMVSMRKVDKAGNIYNATNNSEIINAWLLAVGVVEIGDYVLYDAGEWRTEDLAKITNPEEGKTAGKLHATVNDATTGNQAIPNAQGQFGGFELGDSRNGNSKEGNSSYLLNVEGWRVWDKDEETGVVTLITAGHPETYYHASGYSNNTYDILRNRDYSMYVNEHATSANVLTGQEAVRWYNKQYTKNYTIVENGGDASKSTFYYVTFPTTGPIDVLENGAYCWLASKANASGMYFVAPSKRLVSFTSTGSYRNSCLSYIKSRCFIGYEVWRWNC